MKSMDTAPTDGTRILIKCQVKHYSMSAHRYTVAGTQWQECHFSKGKWAEWCGNSYTQSTSTIEPLGWVSLPSEELE